jgi:outer membrane protein
MKQAPYFKNGALALIIINLILSLAAIACHFSGKNEIVFVDSVKLLNGYTGMKEARKNYDAKVSAWKSNLDSLKSEFEAKIKDYQAKQSKLTAKEKALSEELLQSQQQQYLSYQQVVSEKIQKEDQELTSGIVTKVNDFIKRYGEDHGYEIVMAATQYGNIVYSKKGNDITEEVLEGLNSEYK